MSTIRFTSSTVSILDSAQQEWLRRIERQLQEGQNDTITYYSDSADVRRELYLLAIRCQYRPKLGTFYGKSGVKIIGRGETYLLNGWTAIDTSCE